MHQSHHPRSGPCEEEGQGGEDEGGEGGAGVGGGDKLTPLSRPICKHHTHGLGEVHAHIHIRVVLLSMDRFYLSLSEENLSQASNHNFDHPNAFDWNLLESTIRDLATAKSVQVPRYSFKTHQR